MSLGILRVVVVGVRVHFGGAIKVVVGVEGDGGVWAALFTGVGTVEGAMGGCGVVAADDA